MNYVSYHRDKMKSFRIFSILHLKNFLLQIYMCSF